MPIASNSSARSLRNHSEGPDSSAATLINQDLHTTVGAARLPSNRRKHAKSRAVGRLIVGAVCRR
jgi:hypothetical protein